MWLLMLICCHFLHSNKKLIGFQFRERHTAAHTCLCPRCKIKVITLAGAPWLHSDHTEHIHWEEMHFILRYICATKSTYPPPPHWSLKDQATQNRQMKSYKRWRSDFRVAPPLIQPWRHRRNLWTTPHLYRSKSCSITWHPQFCTATNVAAIKLKISWISPWIRGPQHPSVIYIYIYFRKKLISCQKHHATGDRKNLENMTSLWEKTKQNTKNEKLATHLAATHGLAVDDSQIDGWTVHLWSSAYGGSKVVSK